MKLALWFLVAAAPYMAGEYWSKRWANDGTWQTAAFTLVSYLIGNLCWLGIMRTSNKLFVMGIAWFAMSTVTSFFLGVVYFGEKLHWTEMVGTAFALVAFIFLSMKSFLDL